MIPVRKKHSHKGDNGRVLVIGGNEEFHGAPIFAALGAEATGVDLVRLVVPKSQKTLSREWSLNFIVSTFGGEYLKSSDVPNIVRLAKKVDVIVLGMGLGERKATLDAIRQIIKKTSCSLVIDADGLGGLTKISNREVVVTPHIGEALNIFNEELTSDTISFRKQLARRISKKFGVIAVLKGVTDVISNQTGQIKLNKTGNAGMTVGGTGDVLAGIIGGLMAQGMDGLKAGHLAVKKEGETADRLQKKKGDKFTAEDITREVSLD
jgi:NAD(P)H-hydrate epimerase